MVFWVFGYGSLVWNPGFKYDEKVIGYIKDYRRVFDLGKIFTVYSVNSRGSIHLISGLTYKNVFSSQHALTTEVHRNTQQEPAR